MSIWNWLLALFSRKVETDEPADQKMKREARGDRCRWGPLCRIEEVVAARGSSARWATEGHQLWLWEGDDCHGKP
jgi:hypothetical protein